MRVHHINAATLCPRGKLFIEGSGCALGTTRLVCHCLVIETHDGLVLVETGFGTADVADPRTRVPASFRAYARPRLSPEEPVIAQLPRLGLSPFDVRHIVLTHLDLDHAGGLGDFPGAQVHVSRAELDAATRQERGLRYGYTPAQWRHGPRWAPHETSGERWFGFEAVRPLSLPRGHERDDLLLIPLAGHTRGHCGVAVRTGDRWLLHAGDAFFHEREIRPESPSCPIGLRVFQSLLQENGPVRLANQQRLRDLVRDHGDEVRVINSHDPRMFDAAVARADAERTTNAAPHSGRSKNDPFIPIVTTWSPSMKLSDSKSSYMTIPRSSRK